MARRTHKQEVETGGGKYSNKYGVRHPFTPFAIEAAPQPRLGRRRVPPLSVRPDLAASPRPPPKIPPPIPEVSVQPPQP
jgi:hypothetical protein